MDRAAFAEELRQQIVADLQGFRKAHPGETRYGYGLLVGQPGAPYLASVVATEEGLGRVAAKYEKLGYRYHGYREERPATPKELATWLRWAASGEGWCYWGLPDHKRMQQALEKLVHAGGLDDDFEEFCTEVLTSLQVFPAWQEEVAKGRVIVGVTSGEDSRDFLRTATRANPYPVVRRLWSETCAADELRSRIKAPADLTLEKLQTRRASAAEQPAEPGASADGGRDPRSS